MKQTKLWLITIATLLCSITANAHDFEVDSIYYNVTSSTDLTVAVTYKGSDYKDYSDEYTGTVVIPDAVTYNSKSYRVTSIGYKAFTGCRMLTSIIIPVGVTEIGYNIFGGCTSLNSIVIPESVNSIGEQAFYNCSSLTSISIPEGITSIGKYTFGRCSSLTSITIPESVTEIGENAFYACSSLTAITIPEGVTSIGNRAFEDCTGELVVNCNIPSASSYDYGVFYNSRFTKVTIGDKVTSIGDYAFYNCSSLTAITIPEGVTSIGSYTFENCTGELIVNCDIPSNTFYNSKFDKITIGDKVTSVSNYAFSKCTSLREVVFEDGNTPLSLGYNYYSSGTGEGLFYDCPLETVYLGRNLSYSSGSSYGYSPFYNKDVLVHVTIGREVSAVANYAFYGCDNIHSLTINSGVLSIGSSAFSTPDKVIWLTNTPPTGYANAKGNINYVSNDQYTSLSNTKVYPYLSSMFEVDGVKYVPVSPSERTCHAIDCAYDSTATVINVGETASFKGVAMKVTEVMPYTFYGNNYIKEASITHSGNINDYTFYGCSSLEAITLGENISSLGNYAFSGCTGLRELIVPDSVKTIDTYCFKNCSSLTNIVLGNSVVTISNYAFQNCSSLPEIGIPQSMITIGDYAFSGCTQLADVIIEDRTTTLNLGSNGSSSLFVDCPLDSVYIGGKISYNTTSSKGYSPFYRNTSLRTVVITDREEQIYDNEFYGCTNLQNVTIGNGVKSIGNYAFSGCSSLEGFSFGSSMESIGDEAFSDCTNLTSITSHAAVPPTCGTQALDDINKWNCVLGVPLGNAEAYYAADQWKDFFFIEAVVEVDHYVLTYIVDGEVYHTEVLKHKDEVTMLAEPTKVGYTFSGWDKTLTTMPAEDVTISGTFTRLPIENLVILDTETDFVVDEDMECDTITYTRNFDDTNWQALYVPFAIPYDNISKEFDVAYINDMHQFDDDNNGTIDRTEVEAIKITEGALMANYPYLIKAKSTGEKSIVVADATLYVTEENTVDCSSVFTHYTFTGSYSTLSGDELSLNEGYYVLNDGMWQPLAEGASLGAFRIYLKIDSRDGNSAIMAQSAIRMRVVGDDAAGVEYVELKAQRSEIIYDLQGRKVLDTENLKGGVYIVNDKKVVMK